MIYLVIYVSIYLLVYLSIDGAAGVRVMDEAACLLMHASVNDRLSDLRLTSGGPVEEFECGWHGAAGLLTINQH